MFHHRKKKNHVRLRRLLYCKIHELQQSRDCRTHSYASASVTWPQNVYLRISTSYVTTARAPTNSHQLRDHSTYAYASASYATTARAPTHSHQLRDHSTYTYASASYATTARAPTHSHQLRDHSTHAYVHASVLWSHNMCAYALEPVTWSQHVCRRTSMSYVITARMRLHVSIYHAEGSASSPWRKSQEINDSTNDIQYSNTWYPWDDKIGISRASISWCSRARQLPKDVPNGCRHSISYSRRAREHNKTDTL
jgi:hypothetical protein